MLFLWKMSQPCLKVVGGLWRFCTGVHTETQADWVQDAAESARQLPRQHNSSAARPTHTPTFHPEKSILQRNLLLNTPMQRQSKKIKYMDMKIQIQQLQLHFIFFLNLSCENTGSSCWMCLCTGRQVFFNSHLQAHRLCRDNNN